MGTLLKPAAVLVSDPEIPPIASVVGREAEAVYAVSASAFSGYSLILLCHFSGVYIKYQREVLLPVSTKRLVIVTLVLSFIVRDFH